METVIISRTEYPLFFSYCDAVAKMTLKKFQAAPYHGIGRCWRSLSHAHNAYRDQDLLRAIDALKNCLCYAAGMRETDPEAWEKTLAASSLKGGYFENNKYFSASASEAVFRKKTFLYDLFERAEVEGVIEVREMRQRKSRTKESNSAPAGKAVPRLANDSKSEANS